MQLLKLMKRAGVEAVDTASPMRTLIGTVTSIEPLVITIEQRLAIPASFLLLTDNVIDKEVEITVDDEVEQSGSLEPHNHGYTGKKTHIHHKNLKVGEMVLLLRVQGGQQFIVLNRVVSA